MISRPVGHNLETMNEKNKRAGVPESSEYIEELDTIFCQLDEMSKGKARLSREERVILDVYSTIGHVEGDGLLSFWDSNTETVRVLESFRILGANEVAEVIKWHKMGTKSHSSWGSPRRILQNNRSRGRKTSSS